MADNGKYVLVTGGTSGIGYELAKRFAREGYNLVIVARGEEGLEKTATEIREQFGVAVETISKDLFDPGQAFELYDDLRARNITINVLVNNAAQGEYGEFTETDIRKELDIIHLNISSVVVLTKLFLREMVERNDGKILNVSSIAGKLPGPLQSVYHGTKAFVHSFSEAIRDEVKDTGVTVTSLLPGATDTDFFRKAHMEESKIVQEGKLDDPAKVADDGYRALMAGKHKVISGMKNKAQVAMSNIMPDDVVASNLHKQQEPVKK